MGIHLGKPKIKFDPSKIDVKSALDLLAAFVQGGETEQAAINKVAKMLDDAIIGGAVFEILDRPIIKAALRLILDAAGGIDALKVRAIADIVDTITHAVDPTDAP